MSTLNRILLAGILLSSVLQNSGIRITKLCDKEKFYTPYVSIYWQRGFQHLFELIEPGFIDLRNQYGVLLCVNGPAILYTEITERQNQNVFTSNYKIKIYNHECFGINHPIQGPIIPPLYVGLYDNLVAWRELRRRRPYPNELLRQGVDVHGLKVFGITLFGSDDYRNPSLYVFPERNFGNNDVQIMTSPSVALIGSDDWTLLDKFTNSRITISQGPGDQPKLCTLSNGSDEIDANFQIGKTEKANGHNKSEYGIWIKVRNVRVARRMDPIIIHGNIEPFPLLRMQRMIEAVGEIADEGISNRILVGAVERTNETNANTITVIVSDCIPLPKQEDFCNPPKERDDTSCKIIQSAYDLIPIDWTQNKDLEWKNQILELFEDIFIKICSKVGENVVGSVVNLFKEMYVVDLHKKKTSYSKVKDSQWDSLMLELEHCRNSTSEGLEFRRHTSMDEDANWVPKGYRQPAVYYESSKPKRQQMGIPHTNRRRRDLAVIRQDGRQLRILHYEEAAESDYELNIAIDFQWKIFSTVIGYCNKYYKEKGSLVFDKFIDRLDIDFMEEVKSEWTNAKDNDVYSFIVGEDAWVDECLEGSYIHSASEELRPVRQLRVHGKKHFNHFTKIPDSY